MDPQPRFAWNGDSTVAYEVVGDGPLDLVYMPGYINNLEAVWDNPLMARFLRRLSSFSRLIVLDRRGMGLSDRLSPEDLPPLEELTDDVDAVLDAVGSERAVVFGTSDCGAIGAMYAASHPDRTAGLIVYASSPSGVDPGDWGTASAEVSWDEEGWRRFLDDVRTRWGTLEYAEESLSWIDPSLKGDRRMVEWWARFQRLSVTPTTLIAVATNYMQLDVRPILPTIGVPTLVMSRSGDLLEPVAAGRDYADRIPGAEFVELAGADHHPWAGDQDAVLVEVERFVRSVHREEAAADRVLATVLFTDIVDSTAQAATLGGRRMARGPGTARSDRPGSARPFPRTGDQDDGRWVPRDVRRSRSGDPVRTVDRRRGVIARDRGSVRAPHGGGRARRGRRHRHRGRDRCAGRGDRGTIGGPGVADGEGPRGRERPRVR